MKFITERHKDDINIRFLEKDGTRIPGLDAKLDHPFPSPPHGKTIEYVQLEFLNVSTDGIKCKLGANVIYHHAPTVASSLTFTFAAKHVNFMADLIGGNLTIEDGTFPFIKKK